MKNRILSFMLITAFFITLMPSSLAAASTYADAELKRAVELGFGEYREDNPVITYAQFFKMLDKTVELAEPSKLATWSAKYPEGRKANEPITRIEAMLVVLKCAVVMGDKYLNCNGEAITFTGTIWENLTKYNDGEDLIALNIINNPNRYIEANDRYSSGGFTDRSDLLEWANDWSMAFLYSFHHVSRYGNTIFNFDMKKHSMRPGDKLTYAEALLAAIRLKDSGISAKELVDSGIFLENLACIAFVPPIIPNPNPKIIYADANNERVGDGTKGNPYKTLTDALHAAKTSDTIIVSDGVYYGTFAPPSGTPGRPTTLKAAEGARPVLTTAIPLKADWRVYKDKIYTTDVPSTVVDEMETGFPQLFVDGNAMVEARYPNAPGSDMSIIMYQKRSVAQAGTKAGVLIAPDKLPSDIGGAKAHIWRNSWGDITFSVSGASGNKINLSGKTPPPSINPDGISMFSWDPEPDNAFYIVGALPLLDVPGEYYYDKKTRKLYFYAPDGTNPNGLNLSLRSKANVTIDLYSVANVTVDSFDIYGGGVCVIGKENIIQNCSVRYAENFDYSFTDEYNTQINYPSQGFVLAGENNTVRKCEIGPTAGYGIITSGSGNVLTNNIIHDCGYGAYIGSVYIADSENLEISYNNIYNGSLSLINFANRAVSKKCVVKNNLLKNPMLLNSDGGAIYGYATDGGGTEIYNNFIDLTFEGFDDPKGREAAGLYPDCDTPGFIIHHNIVLGGAKSFNTQGIATVLSSSDAPSYPLSWTWGLTQIYNNTIIGMTYGYVLAEINDKNRPIEVKDNLFVDIKEAPLGYWDVHIGDFINGKVPAPRKDGTGGVTSSGNTIGTVDSGYKPTGKTPTNVGAIPKDGKMFTYGVDWKIK